MNEPSVLDYVKAWLSFGRIPVPEIPPLESDRPSELVGVSESGGVLDSPNAAPTEAVTPVRTGLSWPLWSLAATGLALLAQSLLEPDGRAAAAGVLLYTAAAVILLIAIRRGQWRLVDLSEQAERPISMDVRAVYAYASLPLVLLAFFVFGGNRFTSLNVLIWGAAMLAVLGAFWQGTPPGVATWRQRISTGMRRLANGDLVMRLTPWLLLSIGAVALVFFFRFSQLALIPGEPFSDHAEKLLDVADVLDGYTAIFFPRNTGREAFQMYLTAFVARDLGQGLTFMSLKIGTALAGLFALPFIYLLGKELGNRWVGLFAFVLAGIAYWPNIISRVGLRFPLYPLFVAPMLFFLIRGLRRSSRNDLLLAGLALGIGLHGYSPMRIVPLVVIAAFVIYLLHRQSQGKRVEAFWGLVTLAYVAFIVFLPLLRYAVENPEVFNYRALTRLSTLETAFSAPPLVIFLGNMLESLVMYFWDNGGIWVHSIPNRPALDVVTAGLFFLGASALLARYLRRRHWLDLFMLLSVPLLMLPSVLSLAFPEENPSLNRSGAAIVPVFIIAALGLEALLSGIIRRNPTSRGRMVAVLIGGALLFFSIQQNYGLVFDQYKNQFFATSLNTSEMGEVIRDFADSVGSEDSAYVVPYPYWVDTRLVGINAGYPRKDYAIYAQDFQATQIDSRAKLFLLKPEDQENLELLRSVFPQGTTQTYLSKYGPEKNFTMFFVPPTGDEGVPVIQ
jgi:hypothetical protein